MTTQMNLKANLKGSKISGTLLVTHSQQILKACGVGVHQYCSYKHQMYAKRLK